MTKLMQILFVSILRFLLFLARIQPAFLYKLSLVLTSVSHSHFLLDNEFSYLSVLKCCIGNERCH